MNELILISENEKSSKINRNFKSNKNGNSGGMEMKFPVLETPRLRLVQIGPEHIDALFGILSKDEVTEYYGMDSL